MAPEGTVRVTLVAVEAVTVDLVAPKKTMLFVVMGLKLVPVNVTTSPGLALIGLNEVMVGTWAKVVKVQPINITKSNKGLRL